MNAATYIDNYRRAIREALDALIVTDTNGESLETGIAFDMLCALTKRIKEAEGTLFFCGNGASSAMASHLALDWLKAAEVRAMASNDPVSLTAIGNDLGYENVFALPVRRLGRAGDLLATISSSGNSPSVLVAIEAARKKRLLIVTFSGFKPDNKSREMGDLNFYIPCTTYGVAECCHQVLLHAWLDQYLGIKG